MKDVLISLITSMGMPFVISIGMAILLRLIQPIAKSAAESYGLYRDKLLEEAKKFHAEAVVRAVEQAARANLLDAAERHHTAAAMLMARVPGVDAKDADKLILATVQALKEEFAKADDLSENKVKIPGEPLVTLDAPLVEDAV